MAQELLRDTPMEQFRNCLISSKLTDDKRADYYLDWIAGFHKSFKKKPEDPVTQEEMDQLIGFKVMRVQGFE